MPPLVLAVCALEAQHEQNAHIDVKGEKMPLRSTLRASWLIYSPFFLQSFQYFLSFRTNKALGPFLLIFFG